VEALDWDCLTPTSTVRQLSSNTGGFTTGTAHAPLGLPERSPLGPFLMLPHWEYRGFHWDFSRLHWESRALHWDSRGLSTGVGRASTAGDCSRQHRMKIALCSTGTTSVPTLLDRSAAFRRRFVRHHAAVVPRWNQRSLGASWSSRGFR
jgi:hypothetical protein